MNNKKLNNSTVSFFLLFSLAELQVVYISPSQLRQLTNFKENWISGVRYTSALRKGDLLSGQKQGKKNRNQSTEMLLRDTESELMISSAEK